MNLSMMKTLDRKARKGFQWNPLQIRLNAISFNCCCGRLENCSLCNPESVSYQLRESERKEIKKIAKENKIKLIRRDEYEEQQEFLSLSQEDRHTRIKLASINEANKEAQNNDFWKDAKHEFVDEPEFVPVGKKVLEERYSEFIEKYKILCEKYRLKIAFSYYSEEYFVDEKEEDSLESLERHTKEIIQ